MSPTITIRNAETPDEMETLRMLLREYQQSLNADLGGEHICVSGFEQELAALPGKYAAPNGAMLLAFVDGEPAGCVVLRPLDPAPSPNERACEMKRLWVRPRFRGLRLGLRLTQAVIDVAATRHYTAIYLDTAPAIMQSANRIYRDFGFEPVARYHDREVFSGAAQDNPPEVAFFRKAL